MKLFDLLSHIGIILKKVIIFAGFRCTAGSLLLKDLRAQEDGVSVTLMKNAGAIILASTNAPECGLHFQTSNYIHGTTLNPYDTSRTSGGSSGTFSFIDNITYSYVEYALHF